ncbi:GGDEF domain-containing phosphodiesterase [Serpentinicella alkaliphila]|uniref:PAS domain S-box-containing protein/diguanylate cyclase (GGDEF)-like protein n=1 Tax=Serpentinicella alkaliphila TaxID=1734049 RepID=A0A4R2T6T7_9FIRM|nr:GGDEF domain-containing phosphodiesterase [Serpentinicella alkaliphila]QUH25586.1 EAL domain-containing protein [Serpentinicella alkaliphila]TCP97361.1 PAS domain S-box-containing protein/diguanylate cyclase (GGDEF)-like protein [Serpentinicella alkaliphila]
MNLLNQIIGIFKQNSNERLNDRVINPTKEALKITLVYGFLGFLWILLSDRILYNFVQDPIMFMNIQTYKGWLFVILTMTMVYLLIHNRMRLLKNAMNSINYSYSELSTTYEKLISTEEELRKNFDEVEKSRNELIESNLRYKLVVEGSKEGIWEWESDSEKYYFSIKTKDILGYNDGEIDDSFEAWVNLIHPDDKNLAMSKLKDYFESKDGIYESTYRLRAKCGEYRWILSRGKALRDEYGNIKRMGGSHTDITKQLKLRDNLKREVILSESVIGSVSVLIAIWDRDGRILRFNSFAEKVLGYMEAEVLGKNILDLDLFTVNLQKEDLEELYQKIKTGESTRNLETKLLSKDGKFVDILWNSSILYEDNNEKIEMISVGTDITERKEMEKSLQYLAYIDSLTGIPNRVSFEEKVVKLTTCKEKNENFAIIYMDIDNFKHINDTLGHAYGDKLLKHVCEVLKLNVHENDSIFRLGGDEFAIIFNNFETKEILADKLEELLVKLRKPWVNKNQEFFISFSIGIVIYPEHGSDFMTLLKNADTAMYCAKDMGKDKYCFYSTELQNKIIAYIQMVNQIRHGIDKEEFQLYYQPQIELRTGKITAVEALIRWNHPEKGFVSPMEFIPIAENSGQIQQITEWVVKTALTQKKEWDKKGYFPIKMSVNFSGKCFAAVNLVDKLRFLISSMDIKYNEIQIEITETAFMSDLNFVIEIVNQLRDLGIKIALDDFGTGYSSLTYLKRLPIDILKMDRGFIKNIKNDLKNHDEIIAKTVIQLAKELNINVVAEGIETSEQLIFLNEHGCNEGQGYYFSRPIPAEEIESLLENHHKYLTNNYKYDDAIEEILLTYDKEA